MARIGKYNKKMLAKAKKEAEKGLSEQQIANNLGIHVSTLCDWKNKFPEFSEVIMAAKDRADEIIENSMYAHARGMELTEEHTHLRKEGDREVKEIKKIKKQIAPDTKAGIFWLTNRKKKKWVDRRDDHITLTNAEDILKAKKELDNIINESTQKQMGDDPKK